MDHLPHPADPFEPLKILHFNGPAYTPPFNTFPSRHDWDARGGLRTDDPARFLGLAQSWAFFGLLHDFLNSAGVGVQNGGGILDDFLCDERGYCLEEPDGLVEGWEGDETLRYTEHGGTQAPRRFWQGSVTNSSERGFVTTKRLWWHLHGAIRALGEKPVAEAEQVTTQLEKRLSEAYNLVHKLEHDLPTHVVHTHDDPSPQVAFEEQCLALCLSIHALRHALIQARLTLEKGHGMEGAHGSTLLARRMARQGWCPYQAEWVAKNFGPLSGYYIALLGPRPTPLQCHISCDGRKCSLLQIDEASYATGHRPGCGEGCEMVAPCVKEICAILEDGGVPILVVRCDENGGLGASLDVRVERCAPGREFYAVSHVWSDGMGNPRANALPTCQLSMLVSTALEARRAKITPTDGDSKEKEDPEIAIWMDTLCVPLVPKARKLAIQRMKLTYSLAARVLVFDAALQQCSLQGASSLEQGYRVLSCNWQRRLWTLQEAVFAPKLSFRFADGILFFEDLPMHSMEEEMQGPPPDIATLEMRMALRYFCSGAYRAEVNAEVVNQTARVDRLIETVTHFCHRTTSRMSDEAICLATLLDADVGAILDTPAPERLRRVLEHQRGFSPSVIFLHGPKMQEEPWRWAPASLMYPWNSIQRHCFTPLALMGAGSGATMKLATVTSEGLLLDLPGIIVCAPDRGVVSGTHFFVVDRADGGNLLSVSTIPEDGSDSGGVPPTLTFEREGNTETGNIIEQGREAEATHTILLVSFMNKAMVGYKQLAPSRLVGLVVSGLEQTTMEIGGQQTEVLTGRCEARVNVVEVKNQPHLLEKHGKKVFEEEGNVKGISIGDSALRGQVVQDRLLKMCIR